MHRPPRRAPPRWSGLGRARRERGTRRADPRRRRRPVAHRAGAAGRPERLVRRGQRGDDSARPPRRRTDGGGGRRDRPRPVLRLHGRTPVGRVRRRAPHRHMAAERVPGGPHGRSPRPRGAVGRGAPPVVADVRRLPVVGRRAPRCRARRHARCHRRRGAAHPRPDRGRQHHRCGDRRRQRPRRPRLRGRHRPAGRAPQRPRRRRGAVGVIARRRAALHGDGRTPAGGAVVAAARRPRDRRSRHDRPRRGDRAVGRGARQRPRRRLEAADIRADPRGRARPAHRGGGGVGRRPRRPLRGLPARRRRRPTADDPDDDAGSGDPDQDAG